MKQKKKLWKKCFLYLYLKTYIFLFQPDRVYFAAVETRE